MKTAPTKVPTFASDGRRLRAYSLDAAEHLAALSFVAAKRNRKGVILAIFFRDAEGGSPMRATLQGGQRYSFLERVGESHAWAHKELDTDASDFQRCALDVRLLSEQPLFEFLQE